VNEPVDIGRRVEMFVDDWLIGELKGLSLQLQRPLKREVVLSLDQPWEGKESAYFCVMQDGRTIRLYYRGCAPTDESAGQVTCLAESEDGVHFNRPSTGIIEFGGSKDNNIVRQGIESHNMAPFVDTNPEAVPQERYKAVAGTRELYAMSSPDGIHWKRMQEKPLDMPGAFDSLNVAFWDKLAGCYRCFSRYLHKNADAKCRAIQSATSNDFIYWSDPKPNVYEPSEPMEQLYTNATVQCPGAPHMFLSFPKRFVPDRKKVAEHPAGGVSDAVFMSSRDGVHWDRRFMTAWVRPGMDPRNWTDRNNMPAWGILETSPAEFTMYISEHYRWDDARLRRLTLRRHGFASLHADWDTGEMITRPLRFSGRGLMLNYSTSAAGFVRVELQDVHGHPIEGHALCDMKPLYGDALDEVVVWQGNDDLSALAGKPVRLRFVLKDADLFALRTGEQA